MKLGELATVRSGLVLSRKQANGPSPYRYPLLTLKSIRPDSYITSDELDWYNAVEPLKPEYLTHVGDIIVRLSIPYTAVLIDENTEGMVIPSSFTIIRANRNHILPEYLFWLLNTKKVRQNIFENTTGNMLGAIKPSYFSDFPVSPISLTDQAKVAALNDLARQEIRLLTSLAEEKTKLYAATLDKIQKDMRGK